MEKAIKAKKGTPLFEASILSIEQFIVRVESDGEREDRDIDEGDGYDFINLLEGLRNSKELTVIPTNSWRQDIIKFDPFLVDILVGKILEEGEKVIYTSVYTPKIGVIRESVKKRKTKKP